jgi:hypothetical protein
MRAMGVARAVAIREALHATLEGTHGAAMGDIRPMGSAVRVLGARRSGAMLARAGGADLAVVAFHALNARVCARVANGRTRTTRARIDALDAQMFRGVARRLAETRAIRRRRALHACAHRDIAHLTALVTLAIRIR